MVSQLNFISIILLIGTITNALPIFHRKQIVTRIHTASTTNTITDVYSTTTEVIVAPTVEFIISGDVTLTTTIVPEGVNPTAEPTTTITKVLKKMVTLPADPTTSTLQPTTATTQPSTTRQAQDSPNVVATSATLNHNHAANADPSSIMLTVSSFNAQQDANNQQNAQAATTTLQPQTTTSTTSSTSTSSTTSTSTTAQQTTTAANNAAIKGVPTALAYSPYNDDGSCKSADQVSSDLTTLKNKGVSKIRIYGTDCNSLETVQPAAKQLGLTINQGLWIDATGVDSLDSGLQLLISYGQSSGWKVFDFITIGNEAINSGYCSVSDLIAKISSVKAQLQAAGYSGQVTTSEPPVTFENSPELCTSSEIDFVGINPHAYFDTSASAQSAGSFVKGQVELIQQTCGTSNVVVTETGYPSAGIQNGSNIPSPENQIIAVQNILDELEQDITILSFTNDYWKNPGPYGIEQSFGIEQYLS